MREIEFRAWLGDRMAKVETLHIKDLGIHTIDANGISCYRNYTKSILMQYTGCKDKNGVKIFEGDIIKFIDDDDLCYVVFDEYWAGYRFKSKEIDDNFAGFTPKNLEVIGNVWENPELLEVK